MTEAANHEELARIDLVEFQNGSAETRARIAGNVDDICRNIGFLIIENHGFDENVTDSAWSSAGDFFALSDGEKSKSRPKEQNCPRGYAPVEGENLAKTLGIELPADLKETFSSGPLSPPIYHQGSDNLDFFYGDNIWPEKPLDFEDSWTAYYKTMERLGAQIMELLAVALGVEENYFVKYHTHHISALRSQNYPQASGSILPGQLRAGAHSDYGSVTILKPDPDVDGLEVKSPNGGWIKAPIVKNSFIINIGDLLAHWTNDRWVSTLHRVVEPAIKIGSPRRQSIAYFMNPNFDAQISAIPTCLEMGVAAKYPKVLAGDYLIKKFTQAN